MITPLANMHPVHAHTHVCIQLTDPPAADVCR